MHTIGVKQYIDISIYSVLHYLLLQYNTIILWPIENINILHNNYCNILQYIATVYSTRYCVVFSRSKNKMTNKCIKVIISASL